MILKLLTRLVIRLSPINKFIVTGHSMSPSLQDGEEILINKISYLFKHPLIGEIIALRDPEEPRILIKRIERIENNKYFVIGDNKKHSTDSRKFGMLEKKDIIGKVIYHKRI